MINGLDVTEDEIYRCYPSGEISYPGGVTISWRNMEEALTKEMIDLVDVRCLLGKQSICCYVCGRFAIRSSDVDIRFELWAMDQCWVRPRFMRGREAYLSTRFYGSERSMSFSRLIANLRNIDRNDKSCGAYDWMEMVEEQVMVSLFRSTYRAFSRFIPAIYCGHAEETGEDTVYRSQALKGMLL